LEALLGDNVEELNSVKCVSTLFNRPHMTDICVSTLGMVCSALSITTTTRRISSLLMGSAFRLVAAQLSYILPHVLLLWVDRQMCTGNTAPLQSAISHYSCTNPGPVTGPLAGIMQSRLIILTNGALYIMERTFSEVLVPAGPDGTQSVPTKALPKYEYLTYL
jgi:hypothetical protein